MFFSKKLKKFKNLNHCFFSRKGGFSKGIYAGLNCGRGSGDSKKNILKNLDFVSKKMSVRKDRLILMYQTHSKKVVEIKNTIAIELSSPSIPSMKFEKLIIDVPTKNKKANI